jgi:thiol-disulfide isomerase/thioredoxin
MYRAILAAPVCVLICTGSWAQESDSKKSGDAPARSPAATKLLENPNDAQAYSAYRTEVVLAFARNVQTDPDAARRKLDVAETLIADLKIDSPATKARHASFKREIEHYRGRLDAQTIPIADLEKRLAHNPNDAEAVVHYLTKLQTEVRTLLPLPDAAAELLAAGKAAIEKAREAATASAAKQVLMRADATFASVQRLLDISRMSVSDLAKKLVEEPNDLDLVYEFNRKARTEITQIKASDEGEVAKKIEEAKAILQKVADATTNRQVKSQAEACMRGIGLLKAGAPPDPTAIISRDAYLKARAKLTEMIGKDAAPLQVETWINGSPLTDADLKGKVVFLDFWAVWCGPCIATFPHLREWNEKYADKGLVMIGLTNYYNFQWNEGTKKPARATERITPADEQEMLVKFAESYELKHRFAIESERSLSQYYGVTGIPHVVVIDQTGKVRLMKVGKAEENAKEIGEMLAQLLDPKAAGGR